MSAKQVSTRNSFPRTCGGDPGVETAVVTIATDTEVTEMLTEVFGATA